MTTPESQMTRQEIKAMIEAVVDEKLTHFIVNLISGLNLKECVRDKLLLETPAIAITTDEQGQLFEFETVSVNAQGEITQRTPQQARYQTEDLGNDVTLDMVYVPGDTFLMGSPKTEKGRDDSESPQHNVTVIPCYISKYPITQRQWQAIMSTNPASFKGDNHPVERVTWYDAIEFCTKLSEKTGKTYRLPSEAEWEYACRAGTTTPFHFGETITTDLANYNGKYTYASALEGVYHEKTIEVGTFPPNAFGLYDMHGNVWEWTCSEYEAEYKGKEQRCIMSSSHASSIVIRGGSWDALPRWARSTYRGGSWPSSRNFDLGFRVIRM